MSPKSSTSPRDVTSHSSVATHNSTIASPDKAHDSTFDSAVAQSVNDVAVDNTIKPKDCSMDEFTIPEDLTSDSSDESLLDSSYSAKDIAENASVPPYDSTGNDYSIKPSDLDSNIGVSVGEATVDSNTESDACMTPNHSMLDSSITVKDWAHKGLFSPLEPIAEAGSVTESDSIASPVVTSSRKLFFLLAIVVSLVIGCTMVNTMSQKVQQPPLEQLRPEPNQIPSSLKATFGQPIRNWDSLTASQSPETCETNPLGKGLKAKQKVEMNPLPISSSTSTTKNPNGYEPTARARPIVPNLLY
jgi:hypothetical protein